MIQIPYDIIFVGADCSWDEQAQMNLATDMIFLFDMLVSLNTAYYDEMAHLVRSRRAIVNHYLRRHALHAVTIEPSPHAARICGSLSRGWFVIFILNITYCELSKRAASTKRLRLQGMVRLRPLVQLAPGPPRLRHQARKDRRSSFTSLRAAHP